MTATTFDHRISRIESGERLTPAEIRELAEAPDILPLGMLADALRRRLRGTAVTFLRVATCTLDAPCPEAVPRLAREVLVTGSPDSLATAVNAVRAASAAAGGRTVAAFSWHDVERLGGAPGASAGAAGGGAVSPVLRALREAGLDALADLPLDTIADAETAVEQLRSAGFQQLRLTVATGDVPDRTGLWLRASALQDRFGCIQALNPLPSTLQALRPTTGYQDVKMVAAARLAAPAIPSIQVDWGRYGPKLAQVALTFGADDLYGISAAESSPDGRRRAPLEEVRRNIEAAGLVPVERDGRFTLDS